MFFVTGLPRSRTAWFAAFLDGMGGVRCHHELLARCTTRAAFHVEMERPNTGNSDSGLWVSDFQQRWPAAPTLIIERDVHDVRASLAALGMAGDAIDAMLEEQVRAHDALHGMRVDFDDIDRRLPAICDYLGVRYDPRRAALFCNLRIELKTLAANPAALAAWRE